MAVHNRALKQNGNELSFLKHSPKSVTEKSGVRILNLNPNTGFQSSRLWRGNTTDITELDPDWHSRSLPGKTFALTRIAKSFDVILFYSDIRLAGFASFIQKVVAPSRGLVFQGLLRDVSRYSPDFTDRLRNRLGLWFHRLLVHQLDTVIVHTSAEVKLYSECFKAPKSRFLFIPYFYYEDAVGNFSGGAADTLNNKAPTNVLAIGRHRDFQCFIRALAGTSWQGRIVGGSSDAEDLQAKIPPNVEAHFEVSRAEYRRRIAQSDIVVLPFHADRWKRSLGQIAMFEAMLMRKPVIAANTFQLADYASEKEILYYRPGDAEHLREQIGRLAADPALRLRLVQSALARIHAEFTRDRYIKRLIDACQVTADSQLRVSRVNV